jgi:hypothetical protein
MNTQVNSNLKRTRPRVVPVSHIQPKMLTVPEAVAYARRSRAALYVDIRAGLLEARKAGRRTLISVASLDRMLDDLPPI